MNRRGFLRALQLSAGSSFMLCSGSSVNSRVRTAIQPEGLANARPGSDAERAEWFPDAKFGMFIHWGPYSVAGVEASWPIRVPSSRWHIAEAEYVSLYRRFNPAKYDPAEWVALAKAAGQRYMVITAKHHDGFCMFDSALTDYKMVNTPYGRDVIGMLAKAAKDVERPLGFYYSPIDVHAAGYRDKSKPVAENWFGDYFAHPQWTSYLDYMAGQLGNC